jgi:thiol-disulfide isomerase/thioredoxin
MRSTRALVAAWGVAALCAIATPSSRAAAANDTDERLRQLTEVFATLDVEDLDGRRWTSADLRGRVVVLDFWATWCAPCLAEIPVLRRIDSTYDDDRVQVLGVSLDVSDRRNLHAWLNRQRIDWPQVWDGRGYDGELPVRFGVGSLPASVLIGPDGRAVALNLRGERLLAAVEVLVEG